MDSAPPVPPEGGIAAGGEGKGKRRKKNFSWGTLDYMLQNFTLIYGTKTVWDAERRIILPLDALSAAYPLYVKMWKEHPLRKIIDAQQVVFDPTRSAGPECINLFDRLPMEPRRGKCERILQLLNHLCGGELEVIEWVQRWIAYQVRHVGAKMATSIVMHGDEGSGKSLFWEDIVKPIFGQYATTIGQDQLEIPYNSWASRKLLVIADEVVSRNELRHQKGRLKRYVTGPTVQINEKHLPIREEANHMNFVYLSNETQPLALDESDRRYMVVWTPPKREDAFYSAVREEIAQGGIEAFYWYLLHEVDLAGFHAHTKPFETGAKRDLIELSLNSAQLFWRDWSAGSLPVPFGPCRSLDLYHGYRIWCERTGERYPMTMHKFSREIARYCAKGVKHFVTPEGREQGTVFLPAPYPRDSAKSAEEWIGEHVRYFEGGLARMRREWGRLPPDL